MMPNHTYPASVNTYEIPILLFALLFTPLSIAVYPPLTFSLIGTVLYLALACYYGNLFYVFMRDEELFVWRYGFFALAAACVCLASFIYALYCLL